MIIYFYLCFCLRPTVDVTFDLLPWMDDVIYLDFCCVCINTRSNLTIIL